MSYQQQDWSATTAAAPKANNSQGQSSGQPSSQPEKAASTSGSNHHHGTSSAADAGHHHDDEEYDALLTSSYQKSRHVRDLPAPIIHYDDDNSVPSAATFFRGGGHHGVRGDAQLRPNIGLTNSYDYAIFGLALHELLTYLRYVNMGAGGLAVTLLLLTWLFKAIALQWSRLVLSCYLGGLSAALLAVEVLGLYRLPGVDEWLRDNLGVLYRPLGKVMYLYLLAILSWAVRGVYEYLLGFVFFCSATTLLAAWCCYEELRSLYREDAASRSAATPLGAFGRPPWTDFSNKLSNYSDKASMAVQQFRNAQSITS